MESRYTVAAFFVDCIVMQSDREKILLEEIDCKLPYSDKDACMHFIDRAVLISLNAVFAIVEELCRIPSRQSVSEIQLISLLDYVDSIFEHPLKPLVLNVASKMIRGEEVSVADAKANMNVVKNISGQFAALNIMYFSCDDETGEIETLYQDIVSDWNYNNH